MLEIRRARRSDAQAAFDIRRLAILDQCGTVYPPEQVQAWTDVPLTEWYRDLVENHFHLVCIQGNPVATGMLDLERRELGAIFVHPGFMQRGVGMNMVTHLECLARQAGLTEINLLLYVGKTWNSTWQYACLVGGVPGYHENASVVGNVEGIESVTTAAGTFNALRISYVISYSNLNDPAGFTTYNETIKTWWSTELGRIVKWQDTYGYPTSFSDPTYLRTYTQELTSVK